MQQLTISYLLALEIGLLLVIVASGFFAAALREESAFSGSVNSTGAYVARQRSSAAHTGTRYYIFTGD